MKTALVLTEETSNPDADLIISLGNNVRFNADELTKGYGKLTSLENDLLTVAVSIFAADLAFTREPRENLVRAIELFIPVVNYQAFERLKPELTHILWILTHDTWRINFTQKEGIPEGKLHWPEKKGRTLLFSGGLDSLAGAVDFLHETGPKNLLLASHQTANNVTRNSQNALIAYLTKSFGKINKTCLKTRLQNTATFPFPTDNNREETQRARSFMFLAIGAIASRRSGFGELVALAENGQMAIHLPLTAARIGAFSTHTAHPNFIAESQHFFSSLLNFQLTVTNPYLYKTKSEVVRRLTKEHREAIPLSCSCWRGVRVSTANINHCGQCVPCLIRRISLESNDLFLSEYARNLFIENISMLEADDEGKRNIIDLSEFAYRFSHETNSQLLDTYPDLVSPHFDFDSSVKMYRRFAGEANKVINKYKNASHTLLN